MIQILIEYHFPRLSDLFHFLLCALFKLESVSHAAYQLPLDFVHLLDFFLAPLDLLQALKYFHLVRVQRTLASLGFRHKAQLGSHGAVTPLRCDWSVVKPLARACI